MDKDKDIISKFLNGECSEEQLREAYQLMGGGKEFEKKTLDRIEEEWDDFNVNTEHLVPASLDEIYSKIKQKSGIGKVFTFRLLKIAASITLIGIVTFFASRQLFEINYFKEALAYQEVTTKRGETKTVQLSDGSEIIVNAESKLKFPKQITVENRDIHVEGGAYFKVKNRLTSLVIHADDVSAEVSGGSFNVSAYPDDAEIVIAVEDGGTIKASFPMLNVVPAIRNNENQAHKDLENQPDTKTLLVSKDEYFSYNKKVHTLLQERYNDQREYFAWIDGTIFFDNMEMKQVLKQLSRRFDVDFNLEGCFDNTKTFSGEYKNSTLAEILSQTYPIINADILENKHEVILTGKCN